MNLASYVLEPLPANDAAVVPADCHPVGRPSGIIRVVVPDLGAIAAEYVLDRDAIESPSEGETPADRFHARLRMQAPHRPSLARRLLDAVTELHPHTWMSDGVSAIGALCRAGVAGAAERECRDGDIADIDRLEDPGRVGGGEGACVEAHRR